MSATSDRPTEITPRTVVRWPLVAILAAAATITTGAVIAGEHYAGISRAVGAATKAVDDGGIVSKGTLRAVLREMRINCAPLPGGGLACRVEPPKEAD